MPEPIDQEPNRFRMDGVDWAKLFPFFEIFRSFKMAMQPGKLFLALMLVVLLYLAGHAMDRVWGRHVLPGEVQAWITLSSEDYDLWRTTQAEIMPRMEREPIFKTVMEVQTQSFSQMISAVMELQFGFRDLLQGRGLESNGVIGGLGRMVVAVPGWLLQTYPAFLSLFLLIAFLATACLGGTICRLAAVEACKQKHLPTLDALGFIVHRYHWVTLTVVIPFALFVVLGLIGAMLGMVFFNLPWLEVAGGTIFPLFLIIGLVMALLMLSLVISVGCMMPAVSVENTDAFDAISRSFNYCVGRLGRWFFYHVVMLVYGAITYVLIGLVIFLALVMTKSVLSLWVFGGADGGGARFDLILPDPELGQLIYEVDWEQMSLSSQIASGLIMVWCKLLVFLLPAYAISFYLCCQTWIYLLLRRSADAISMDQCYMESNDA